MSIRSNPLKTQEMIELNSTEIDTIGEILNISMGAAATAISVMLNRQVSITTPSVKVVNNKQFEFSKLKPAIGIEIQYLEGLHGSNIMIMSEKDVKTLVNLLIDDSESELQGTQEEMDEIHLSALGEIMNQMMGTSCTALASFLNRNINISTPTVIEIDDILQKTFGTRHQDYIVTVGFKLTIKGLLDSEFITIMPLSFTKELVQNAMALDEGTRKREDTMSAPDITGHKQVPKPVYEEDYQIAHKNANKYAKAPAPATPPRSDTAYEKRLQRKSIDVKPLQFGNLDSDGVHSDEVDSVNLGLVMGVDLSVTVEIGRTKKQVKEILSLRQGSIVELDKQAGDPADIFVNGKLIARGDVVVIDDNFGVRITEIITGPSKR